MAPFTQRVQRVTSGLLAHGPAGTVHSGHSGIQSASKPPGSVPHFVPKTNGQVGRRVVKPRRELLPQPRFDVFHVALRRKSLFDWPVAFTEVILIVANCTLAKCSEEHVNRKKQQSHVYIENFYSM